LPPYTPKYPGAIPTLSDLPDAVDSEDYYWAYFTNDPKSELLKICETLGVNPHLPYSTVAERLDNLGGFSSRFSAYRNAPQTIPKQVFTKIQFTHEDFDGLNEYDNSLMYRFVASAAGYYFLHSSIMWDEAEADYEFYLAFYKNGALFGAQQCAVASVAIEAGIQISAIFNLAQNDYIEVFIYHEGTDSWDTLDDREYCFFSGHRLS